MIYMQKGWYHIVNERKTSVFSNGLLWFGAGISIAEILTGMLLAPLGFAKAFAAIILGHLIGGTVMYLAGLIGGPAAAPWKRCAFLSALRVPSSLPG